MFLSNEFKEIIDKYKDILRGNKVVIADSTGVDSSVLLNLLEKYQNEYEYEIIVCHVNHKRRQESECEEAYIRSYCENKHKIYVLELENKDGHIASFQEYARKKRLEFFYDVVKKENAKFLFLAHHLNDDIETFIMHLLRGGSLNSISGMKIINKKDDFYIFRPLLNVTKEEIYKYAHDNNIKYFEDCTNQENDYTRNRVRHNIVSNLFKENPSFGNNFIYFKEQLNYASTKVLDERDEFINKYIEIKDGEIHFNIYNFLNLDNIMQVEVLFEILKQYEFSKNNILEIIKIIKCNKKSFVINYMSLCVIKKDDIIYIRNNTYKKKDFNLIIDDFGTYVLNDEYELEVKNGKYDKKSSNLSISNINVIWYNIGKFPFLVRSRRNGDCMEVSSGHKKIKDLLIDMHISAIDKDKQLLLLDCDSNIIAILGLKKSAILAQEQELNLKIELKRRKK